MKGKSPDTTLAGIYHLREKTSASSGLMGKTPSDMQVIDLNIAGMYAEWLIPSNCDPHRIILYFHGGGYVIGSARGHRVIVAKFAVCSQTRTLCFSYPLAPENPFPDALNSSMNVYQHLLTEGFSSEKIVFMGDSAGGGLCLAVLLALKNENIPLPAAGVVLSPWTDLKNTGKSLETNIKVDSLTWRNSWIDFSKYYCGTADPRNPLISPLYGDLDNLPPLLIFAGEDELLRDDSIRFAQKAKKAGVKVTLRVGEGMFHCYPACAPLFPEATRARDEIGVFIKNHANS